MREDNGMASRHCRKQRADSFNPSPRAPGIAATRAGCSPNIKASVFLSLHTVAGVLIFSVLQSIDQESCEELFSMVSWARKISKWRKGNELNLRPRDPTRFSQHRQVLFSVTPRRQVCEHGPCSRFEIQFESHSSTSCSGQEVNQN